jgi:hypothetical protein
MDVYFQMFPQDCIGKPKILLRIMEEVGGSVKEDKSDALIGVNKLPSTGV